MPAVGARGGGLMRGWVAAEGAVSNVVKKASYPQGGCGKSVDNFPRAQNQQVRGLLCGSGSA